MPNILITADIHLHPDESHPINQAFRAFLSQKASQANALYLLGDTFEVWTGDDIGLATYTETLPLLKQLVEQGVNIYLQYGNRDFLMKKRFWQTTGIHFLPEPYSVEINAQKLLMLHGDALCTDDTQYQKMRKWFRHPLIQWLFLKLPQKKRQQIADQMRQKSMTANQNKASNIMDVNEQAVSQLLTAWPNTQYLIHGHTHRPAQHPTSLKNCQRLVLGDWRTDSTQVTAEYLQFTEKNTLERKLFRFPVRH